MLCDAAQGAKQDELLEPHFRGQLRQQSCLHFLTLAYGRNTAHCLGERSQRFLLAKQGTVICWEIQQSIDKIKKKLFSLIKWLISVHPTTINYLLLVIPHLF